MLADGCSLADGCILVHLGPRVLNPEPPSESQTGRRRVDAVFNFSPADTWPSHVEIVQLRQRNDVDPQRAYLVHGILQLVQALDPYPMRRTFDPMQYAIKLPGDPEPQFRTLEEIKERLLSL